MNDTNTAILNRIKTLYEDLWNNLTEELGELLYIAEQDNKVLNYRRRIASSLPVMLPQENTNAYEESREVRFSYDELLAASEQRLKNLDNEKSSQIMAKELFSRAMMALESLI